MSRSIIVEGKEFDSLSKACLHYGLPLSVVHSRLSIGWTIEEAFEIVPRKLVQKHQNKAYTNDKVIVNGKEFQSCAEACRYFGVSYNTAMKRLERGYTLEDVFNPDYTNKRSKRVTVEGKEFRTIKAACDFYKKNKHTVESRLRAGWTPEQAFDIDIKALMEIDGHKFRTMQEMCDFYGVNKNTYRKRLECGWTVEEALGIVHKELKTCRSITVKGIQFNKKKDACAYFGVNQVTVKYRLRNGKSLDEAFAPVGQYNPIVVEGVQYKNIKDASLHYNIKSEVVRARLYMGWPIDKAFKTPVRSCRRPVCIEGKMFASTKEACEYYDINYSTVKYRLNKDWTIEEALELIPKKDKFIGPVTVGDKNFKSYCEACKYFNIRKEVVKYRLRRGWTIEEAFGAKVRPRTQYETIKIKDKTFNSLAEACKFYDILKNTVRYRLKHGWSIEDALCTRPGKKKIA